MKSVWEQLKSFTKQVYKSIKFGKMKIVSRISFYQKCSTFSKQHFVDPSVELRELLKKT